jgi:F0F1-type ATP synthase assembly protein I
MDEKKPDPKAPSAWTALSLVSEIGLSIAIPTTLCALAGRWLDRHFGTSPLFILIGLFAALAISGVLVVRKGNRYVKTL